MLPHVTPLCSPKLTGTVRVFYLLLSCFSPHFLLTPCLCSGWNCCPNQYASALSNQIRISSQSASHKWLARHRSHRSGLPMLDCSSVNPSSYLRSLTSFRQPASVHLERSYSHNHPTLPTFQTSRWKFWIGDEAVLLQKSYLGPDQHASWSPNHQPTQTPAVK